jgi:hypothetical protein
MMREPGSDPEPEEPGGTAPSSQDAAPGPLPNRFTRATALGCLGILGVLALPGFFLLPLEDWHLPRWGTQTLALAVFGALAGGIWLLARVPVAGQLRGRDAWHPVTAAGRAPLRERPATPGNRAMLALVAALVLLAALGYVLASAAATSGASGGGTALAGTAGLACAALGYFVAVGRLPAPAWGWTRTPIRSGPRPRGVALALFGGAVLGWALLVAASGGYAWGEIGLAVLVLGSVLVPTLAARWSRGSGARGG